MLAVPVLASEPVASLPPAETTTHTKAPEATKPAQKVQPAEAVKPESVQPMTAVHPPEAAVHWGYAGAGAPKLWGSLKPEYRVCGEGKNQSPIDIKNVIEADLAPITFHYATTGTTVLNNGHTIKVDMAPGSFIEVDGKAYNLLQFHFHTPSENTIGGVSYPMEVHLVHSDAAGNLAVVGVMIETGGWNPVLDKVWKQMPQKQGEKTTLTSTFDATALLPGTRDDYRFNGSLTTPPCSEGVRWMLMKKPIVASQGQIDLFTQIMGGPTNRPVQPINARPILH